MKCNKDESEFSDADWGGDLDDRGNMFVLAGGAVSWLSKKQAVVSLCTAEEEYIALSTAAQEAVSRSWLMMFEYQQSQSLLRKIIWEPSHLFEI